MSELLAQELREKAVVRADGTTIGSLYNVTMDFESGTLCDLVVDLPSQPSSMGPAETGDGRLRIPVSMVKAVNDQIVIDTD